MRETDDEAWAAADDLIRYLDDKKVAESQAVLGRTQSEGQKRMNPGMEAIHESWRWRQISGPGSPFYEGTSDIQRVAISRQLLAEDKFNGIGA